MEDDLVQSSPTPSLFTKRLPDSGFRQFEQMLQPISNSPCSTTPGTNDFESRGNLQSRFPKINSWMSFIDSLDAEKSDDYQDCGKDSYMFRDDGFENSRELFKVMKIEAATPVPTADLCYNNAAPDLRNRSEDFKAQACVSQSALGWVASVHKYSTEERRAKIAKYKAKLSNRRAKVPVARAFTGRSKVAKSKRVSLRSVSGLVVEYIVAIDVTRVRFPADALFLESFWSEFVRVSSSNFWEMDSWLDTESISPWVRASVQVIEDAFTRYADQEIFLAYNGGKDCSVVLYLIKRFTSHPITLVYFESDNEFDILNSHVYKVASEENLPLRVMVMDIKEGMRVLTEEGYKACFLGERKDDPGKPTSFFMESSPGWPKFTRIFPILEWGVAEVWEFHKSLKIEACELYLHGFTSLGPKDRTVANPLLGDNPAWELADAAQERAGRLDYQACKEKQD